MNQTVAILHYAAPPGIGGVEITMLHHARVLAAAGHPVRVIAGSGEPIQDNVEMFINPLLSSRGEEIEQVHAQLARGEVAPAFEHLVDHVSLLLEQALRGVNVAIIHNVLTLHKNLAFTAALRRLHDKRSGPRLLAWCHDLAWLNPRYQAELHDGRPWQLLREPWPDVTYVTISQDRCTQLAAQLGLSSNDIAVVPAGVDMFAFYKLEPDIIALITQYQLLEADPLLWLPVRISPRKNIEQAIAIVAALQRKGFSPRLVIAGPPGVHNSANVEYLAQLEDLQSSIGASDTVLFLHRIYTDNGRPRPVNHIVAADFYRVADGLLLPSRAEGFGMPIIEAALMEIPIFCSDIPPFHENAGVAAMYFNPDDNPERVADQLAVYYRDNPRYQLRRHHRLHSTWEHIYRTAIAPLLERCS